MSAKDNFSNNKAKQFLVEHGEKIAFGFCVLLVGIFFLLGRGVAGLEKDTTPTSLRERVVSANAHIAADRWTEVKDLRTPDLKLPEKVKEGRVPIQPLPYYCRLAPPAPEPQALREDPELLAPSKPLTHPLVVSLASPPRTDLRESPLDLLPYAEVKKEKKPARPAPRTRTPTSSYMSEEGGSGYDPYASQPSEEESDPMANAVKEYRKLYPSVIKRLKGFRVPPSSPAIPEAQTIVVGTATVPVMDQWIEFKRKLEDAIGFDAMRDRPIYMWYEVQRQDVTEKSPEEAAWTNATTSWTYETWYTKRYGPGPPPIVDMAYYDARGTRLYDYSLTSPVPLILMRDIEKIVLHPLTPKAKPKTDLTEEETSEDSDDETADPPMGPPGPPVAGARGTGVDAYGRGTYESDSGEYSEGYGEDYGAGMKDFDPETGPAAPYKLVRFFDLNAVNGRKYRYRVRVALVDPNNPLAADPNAMSNTSDGYESSYSSTSSSYASRSSSSESSGTGSEVAGEVSLRWLSKDVRERVEKIREADLKDPRNKLKRRVEWVYTDWSEPSDLVAVPTRVEQVLAGSVTPPSETRISDDISFAKDEPKGKLVVSQWIPYYAVEVPAEKEVTLGTLLNFVANADVLHPIKLLIKRIEDHKFKTDAIVLDMRGGAELPGSDKDNPITAPGEFLVVDADGQLHVQNELDDMDEFRLKLLMPDEEDLVPEYGEYGEGYGEGTSSSAGYYNPSSSRSRTTSRSSNRGSCE